MALPASGQPLRLNQAIAKTGFCSRRKADELIADGKVSINGQICTDFNTRVDEAKDVLTINGQRLNFQQLAYVALNKPKGVVTTSSDEKGRPTVVELLPAELRHLKPVGRLDMYSEGLLILTNDGHLAMKLTHPRHHLPKRYIVSVKGSVSDASLRKLQHGMMLEDGPTQPAKVNLLNRGKDATKVEISIAEGRNRQLRRMFEALGHDVRSLVRVAIGGLQLGHMVPGTWRHLTSQEVSALKEQAATR
jgi:23S rRNA pseudouridine2605 synthase